jgi:hypothetical protein
MRSILFIILALTLSCCCNNDSKNGCTRYYEDGRSKPVVFVPTVIDSTTYDIPWSLSEEFTSVIKQKLVKSGSLFVSSTDDQENHMSYNQNPFSSDLSWVKNSYPSYEFAVFLELVNHVNIPVTKSPEKKVMSAEKLQSISTNLNMAMRIRIVDLRGNTPVIVLQELLTDSYYISKNHIDTDYSHISWGMDEYNTSPMGMAHNQLSKEISRRILDYILLAKSR